MHLVTHHRSIDEVQNALGVGCLIAENRRELEKKQRKYKPGQVSVDDYARASGSSTTTHGYS